MSDTRTLEPITTAPGLAQAVQLHSGTDVNMCYQCGKCAAGCSFAYAMDYPPAQLIHAVRLGLDDLVLNSRSMWLCAACETCTTRCPQEVDIAKVMDAAKIIAVRRGFKPAVGSVRSFHKAALASVRRFGRLWEVGMFVSWKLRTGKYLKDYKLAMRMFRKGKLKTLPTFTGARRAAKIFSRVRKLEKEAGKP
jgi:heterodisulfide reductase subunit C